MSWWDCFSVPEDILFPPFATMVKLAGVQMAEGWDDHGREMLHKIIDESDGVKVNLTSCEANSPGLLTTVFLLTTLGFTMGRFQSFPQDPSPQP